jgi:NADPH:quinone reductase-like Zn-dependent oxidoreductase
MKAAVNYRYGPPEIVSIQTIKIPVPKNNEVLVEIHTSTVNRTDCGFRSAEYFVSRFFSGLIKPKNNVLGCEFAGIIKEIGKGSFSKVYQCHERNTQQKYAVKVCKHECIIYVC